MDYINLTAPCGLDCFNCIGYLANTDPRMVIEISKTLNISSEQAEQAVCKGCRNQEGQIPFLPMECRVYPCSKRKNVTFCHECSDFPCDHLHPYADQASRLHHNTKIFNLCLIKKLGLETWAEDKAKTVKETYFDNKWTL